MVVKKVASGKTARFPESLSLSDLITIVSVAISITLAWGYFGARVAALEKDVIVMKDANDKQAAIIKSIEVKLDGVYSTAHDNEIYIDELFKLLKESQPRHRVDKSFDDYTQPNIPSYSTTPSTKNYLNQH